MMLHVYVGYAAKVDYFVSDLLLWTRLTKIRGHHSMRTLHVQEVAWKAQEFVLDHLEYLCMKYLNTVGAINYVKGPHCCGSKKKQKGGGLRELGTSIAYTRCCKNNCLANLAPSGKFDDSVEMVIQYLDDWYLLDPHTHRAKFMDILRAQTTGISFGGERQGQLYLRYDHEQYPVCRNAFVYAHGRKKTYYDKVRC